jgi:hypothetical protein
VVDGEQTVGMVGRDDILGVVGSRPGSARAVA